MFATHTPPELQFAIDEQSNIDVDVDDSAIVVGVAFDVVDAEANVVGVVGVSVDVGDEVVVVAVVVFFCRLS